MDIRNLTAQDIWSKYQAGDNYIQEKGMVDRTKECWRFYLGDQWQGLETGGEVLPSYNFIKPTIKYKVSTVCNNKVTATYADLKAREDNVEKFKAMNIKFSSQWEKSNMDSVAWKVIRSAAIQGDSYVYWYGVNQCQLLDNTAIILADEQNQDIQEQPYIIIRERVFVKDLREIARQNGVDESDINTIVSDSDTQYLLDGNTDIKYGKEDGKATSIIFFTKDQGEVWYCRCTANCMYQPMQPIRYKQGGVAKGKGLRLYPIINYVWEDKPNNARGMSEVRQLIPNQIQQNKLLAQRAIAIKQCAFPRLAYDRTAIMNPQDIDTIGAAIEVNGSSQAINTMVSYLNPAGLNGEGSNFQVEMLRTTRELAGASENILGQIDPTRVAATAIASLQEASSVTIKEQVSKYEKWVEDTARLWWQMNIVYNDLVMVNDEVVTPEEMEELEAEVRVDVSQDTAYTKEAAMEKYDTWLQNGFIDLEQYAQLLPDNSPIDKSTLTRLLQAKKAELAQQQAPQQPIEDTVEQLEEMEVGDNGMPDMQ